MLFNRKNKIFCVGFNKTGTTSLEQTLINHNYELGNQRQGELLLKDWIVRDFSRIIKLAKSAQAFQDIPFSLPYTFVVMDQNFNDSKFILTIRDSPEIWYESLVRFHSKLWGSCGSKVLTMSDLGKVNYLYPGFAELAARNVFNLTGEDPYEKNKLINTYVNHNQSIIDYFRYRPNDLLVLNLKHEDAYKKFCKFLNIDPIANSFPILNKSD
jgi:hypothetical protein